MINLEGAEVSLPPIKNAKAQYEENWKIMAELKNRIITLRPKLLQQSNKVYHENGLCHIFSCVYQQISKAQFYGQIVNMEHEDVQYPCVRRSFDKLHTPRLSHGDAASA